MQQFKSEKKDVFWSMDTGSTIAIPYIHPHKNTKGIIQFQEADIFVWNELVKPEAKNLRSDSTITKTCIGTLHIQS